MLSLIGLAAAGCGSSGTQSTPITRQQWQRVPWGLSEQQVIDRLGVTPALQEKERCRPSAAGRTCTSSISYDASGDAEARFGFVRYGTLRRARLSTKSWTVVTGSGTSIGRAQYARAITRRTTARRAEARLGRPRQRWDDVSACQSPGAPGCGGAVLQPTRCLRYGWRDGGGEVVDICFNLETGRLLNDRYLTPDPLTALPGPAE